LKVSNSICAFPWVGAAIRPNGIILPCCKFNHNSEFGNVNDIDPRDSLQWNTLRDDMLQGKPISNCQSCYRDEISGIKSLRQESLELYSPTDNHSIPLQYLEVSFDNKCNLACVMCSEEFSTKWQTEKRKHRGLIAKGVVQHGFDYLNWDLSNVTKLKIIGGEPMMSQDKFIELLQQLNLKNLHVIVATNGTILPTGSLKYLLEQCASVSYKLSLDGVGPVNDWIRWPSRFSDIENNIAVLESWWRDNTKIDLQFHTVISIYNIFYLDDLIRFIKTHDRWKVTFNWITYPSWQALAVLPDKANIVKELSRLANEYTLEPNPFLISIDRLADKNTSDWNDAIRETKRLIGERNISPIGFSVD